MPDISQINLPGDNNTYNIADLVARGLIWQGTQAQYDAITTKDPSIVYFITDATGTSLAAVATSGNYADLTNKPTIDTSLNTTSSNAIANGPVASFAESISSTVSNKMDKANPTGTGSLSLNRKEETTIGSNSATLGLGCTASANQTFAAGYNNEATGVTACAVNSTNKASGAGAFCSGYGNIAQRQFNHVFGMYNQADTGGTDGDTKGNYIEIVGKGTNPNSRSNARTLDWNGNEVLAGGLKINGNKDVAVQEDFDSTIGYPTDISSSLTGGNAYITRSGKVCQIYFFKSITGSLGGTANIGKLPSNFIPKYNTTLFLSGTYNGTSAVYSAQVSTNGNISTATGSGSFTGTIMIIGTYMAS